MKLLKSFYFPLHVKLYSTSSHCTIKSYIPNINLKHSTLRMEEISSLLQYPRIWWTSCYSPLSLSFAIFNIKNSLTQSFPFQYGSKTFHLSSLTPTTTILTIFLSFLGLFQVNFISPLFYHLTKFILLQIDILNFMLVSRKKGRSWHIISPMVNLDQWL